jgi:hypothetical protein
VLFEHAVCVNMLCWSTCFIFNMLYIYLNMRYFQHAGYLSQHALFSTCWISITCCLKLNMLFVPVLLSTCWNSILKKNLNSKIHHKPNPEGNTPVTVSTHESARVKYCDPKFIMNLRVALPPLLATHQAKMPSPLTG